MEVAFLKDHKLGGLILQFMPTNLLGAIWLQFAQAISGSKKHRACAACGQRFEVSPDKFRKSKFYCGDACRARMYRSRKDQAQQLAAEGKTPKEIAATLDSDVKTINKWIQQRKR